jgi:hypothetical protein
MTVPVIAVLTKYEALVDRVKGEYEGRQVAKSDILNYAKKEVLDPLKNVANAPAAIVQTHRELFLSINIITGIIIKPLDKGKGCELLTQKTFEAIKNETLATIFAMAQQNSMKLACQLTFKQNLYVYFINIISHLSFIFLEHNPSFQDLRWQLK